MRYVQIALRKKQLVAFFVQYFYENTICIDFQFHDPKSQEGCFIIYIYAI